MPNSEVIPGAIYELRPMTRVLRHQTEIKLAPQRHQGRLLLEQYQAVLTDDTGHQKLARELVGERLSEYIQANDGKPPSAQRLTAEEKSELARITVEMELASEATRMEITRARLASVYVPDRPEIKTADDLLNSELEEFALEVESAANDGWQITEAKRKNSVPPGNSNAQADTAESNTTAGNAESGGNTQTEIAA